MIPAITALLLGLLLGYRWGKQDGRAVTRRPPPVTPEGGSVRADLLEEAHRHIVSAHIEAEMGTASTERDELEDWI